MDKILIIEDDVTLSNNIKEAMTSEGYTCDVAFDGHIADRFLKKETYKCIIMDINLPGKNGYEVCKDFRLINTTTPVLMLTAFDELDDKVKGFEIGADDYLTKPFFMRELLLRVQALIKRSESILQPNATQNNIVVGDISIDTFKKTVTRQSKEIILTPREYQILKRLCLNPSEIISKEALIKEVWGTAFSTNTNTIEVYINFLRNKIDKPFDKNSIKTRVGYGYYIEN